MQIMRMNFLVGRLFQVGRCFIKAALKQQAALDIL
jgi:hypothetical protein